MRFDVVPGFVHCEKEPRYFVRSLDPQDDGYRYGYLWQVQLLDKEDRGGAVVEFGPDDGLEFIRMLAIDLPEAVVKAAQSGMNDYVDREGRRRLPSFLGGQLA